MIEITNNSSISVNPLFLFFIFIIIHNFTSFFKKKGVCVCGKQKTTPEGDFFYTDSMYYKVFAQVLGALLELEL